MEITVQTLVNADLKSVWHAWSNPTDIKQWNAASDDWHTTASTVDLREVTEGAGGILVRETFEAETENQPELQRQGWQAILDQFATHVEAKAVVR